MSVARPAESGCRLVRVKRVPSSEFHSPIGGARYEASRLLKKGDRGLNSGSMPVINTIRRDPGSSRVWISRRLSDLWTTSTRSTVNDANKLVKELF